MNSSVMIGNRAVGFGKEPFVVAEVGINHNGELERALEMVNVAKDCGCDAVKFQTFKANEFVNDPTQMYTYHSQGREVTESMLEMFQRYELPKSAWKIIKDECERIDIAFFSTPQNETDLAELLEVGVPAIKVGSDDLTNLPLLKKYTACGLPIILSTGMSDLAEAHQALETVGALDGYPAIILVCTSQYPTPVENVNLARISTLRSAFPMVPVGFSDHTSDALASSLAVALGAVFLEKHFTLSHDLAGPDHWFSVDPAGLKDWVTSARNAYRMLGSPLVRPTGIERVNKKEFQRRIVAARDIGVGEVFCEQSICLKRVSGGRGLAPHLFEYLLGRASLRSYLAGEPIEI